MDKLELKHIAPYFPYVLIGDNNGTKFYLGTFDNMLGNGIETRSIGHWINNQVKPILRPLSNLTKDEYNFIYENETDFDSIESLISLDSYSFQCSKFSYLFWENLFHYHFDVFGLIEKGFAVDINTLE